MAYKRSVETHDNILKNLLPDKRSKEHIESKTQCQEHSNSHNLSRFRPKKKNQLK